MISRLIRTTYNDYDFHHCQSWSSYGNLYQGRGDERHLSLFRHLPQLVAVSSSYDDLIVALFEVIQGISNISCVFSWTKLNQIWGWREGSCGVSKVEWDVPSLTATGYWWCYRFWKPAVFFPPRRHANDSRDERVMLQRYGPPLSRTNRMHVCRELVPVVVAVMIQFLYHSPSFSFRRVF